MARSWRSLTQRWPEVTHIGLPLLALAVVALLWLGYQRLQGDGPGHVDLPDFRSIEQSAERKRAFLDFLRPIVAHENERILRQRRLLLDMLEELESGDDAAAHEQAWLAEQAERYRVKASDDLDRAQALAVKIDIVPTSLALAQAALESAWGTSRFARQGNNLFGEWCFEPGCGIEPKRRPDDATYEVEVFDTVRESVRAYMSNINSHPAYAPARQIRAAARSEGRLPTGLDMAAGLINYAAIGEEYVKRVRSVIRRNDLQEIALAS